MGDWKSEEATEYFSLSSGDAANAITPGTSINVISVTKRGAGKSSILKQVESDHGMLSVKFGETFTFKASMFYDGGGKSLPKSLRLNINKVCRLESSREFSSTCIGFVMINLHDHVNTGETHFTIPVQVEGASTSIKASLEFNLLTLSNIDDNSDDRSSIGSDLSFMQKETHTSRQKGTAHRVVGGSVPEAGTPSVWNRQPAVETEVALTEMSILRMHLDRSTADKESLEAQVKDLTRELNAAQAQLREKTSSWEKERSLYVREIEEINALATLLSAENTSLKSMLRGDGEPRLALTPHTDTDTARGGETESIKTQLSVDIVSNQNSETDNRPDGGGVS